MATTAPRLSRDLADYHAVIATDIKDFTSNKDTDNRFLARRLPQVLGEAFALSDLDFSCLNFPGQAGDGYAAGIDYHKLPHLIHPLLDRLQDVLAELDAELRARDRGLRMRLRASIHIGPLADDDDPAQPGGIGKAMNDLHRLLDADPVRDALRDTDPDTTFVAAVISQRAYEDAIHTGACALPASLFTPIDAHVKRFSGHAWLYVPEPSGQSLRRAFMSSDGIPQRAGFPAQQVTTPLQHATDAMPTGIAGPKFQIENAGQVAGTVTAPVTIHQILHGNVDLGIGPGEFSESGAHNSQPSHPSRGESQ